MNVMIKILGAIDLIGALLIIASFSALWAQIIGWALAIKGLISLLS
ncbi:MAG: hypothetical protein QW548_02880 [Candidatus Aenigmatarchaeota archaeon]